MRVNVQLVDAASEESVWSETFDRTWSVDALLDVQAEIAEAVALALASTLTDTERTSLATALGSVHCVNVVESTSAYPEVGLVVDL